jgi:hypothetical protein
VYLCMKKMKKNCLLQPCKMKYALYTRSVSFLGMAE